MKITITPSEIEDTEWWLRHHKGNVQYLAMRIKRLVENPDDEDYRAFFYGHFSASIKDFLKTVGQEPQEKGE